MKEDIKLVRAALQSAKTNTSSHQYGGLHNLWSQLVEALEALKRIEQRVTIQQMPLFPDTADYKKNV